jgi:phospholipase C
LYSNMVRLSDMRLGPLALAAMLGGCSSIASSPSQHVEGGAIPEVSARVEKPATPIRHVVIIIQENRTVDNLFNGYPNADTQNYGYMSDGTRVTLQPVSLNSADIDNTWWDSRQSWDNGKMDGFDKNPSGSSTAGAYAYSYVDRNDSAPYWAMAKEFELADHMFPTAQGESWAAHIDLIASTTNLTPTKAMIDFPSNSPWDCTAPEGTHTPTLNAALDYDVNGPFPCFSQLNTMANTLDAAHVPWRFYGPNIEQDFIGGAWSAFSSIHEVRFGPDWRNIITPPPTILNDVKNGHLDGVTWVVPDWQYSDHAGSGTTLGPSWVAAVVNTIGESKFWNTTAIVVVWDDFGGWFDHVPPPQLDFKGLGIRVPCLVISPYVHRGSVDHTQYEFGSVLRFTEDVFGLPALGSIKDGYSDLRGTSLTSAFDFTQKPRPFHAIKAPVFSDAFARMKPSGVPPDK